jgi:hypothetical protein
MSVKEIFMWLRKLEYISRLDATIFARLEAYGAELHGRVGLRILELGVYRGGFVQTVLMNNASSHVTGIDPYPFLGGNEMRQEMLQELTDLDLTDRFALLEEWRASPETASFDVMHIDGEHSEVALRHDLEEASKRIADDGMIIVDDVRHGWFPGVASATYRFLEQSEFCLLADSGQKFYLVRKPFLEKARASFIATYQEHLAIYHSYADFEPNAKYLQLPDVGGNPVLLVREKSVPPAATKGIRWRRNYFLIAIDSLRSRLIRWRKK